MDASPDREAPTYYNKFSKSSFSSHSDVSLDGKEDKRDRKVAKSNKKDQQGYCHLERASSEEELVDGQFRSKPKKSNVFGKLKSKSKTVSLDEKVPTSTKNFVSSGKHSTSKHVVKNSKVGSDTPSSPNKDGRGTGNRPVFGLPLRHALKNNPCHDRIPVPAVFRMCIDYINENGLKVEGIYRLSPSKSQLEELRQVIESGILSLQYDVLMLKDPLCAAALLKSFLRELPDDLLTTDLHAEFEQAVEKSKTFEECIERLKGLLNHLPESNRMLLAYLFSHMKMIIDNAEYNKMTLANIGLVLQPAVNWSQSLLNVFLQHSVNLFSDVKIKRYVPPIKANSSKLSMEFPSNVKDIDEELIKQESLLNYLHEDIKSGNADSRKEEQLWDVQRLITQLKRELKKLKKHYQNSPLPFSEHITPENQPAICLEMFEEKQLLAVQTELRESIETEEKLILALMEKLKAYKAGQANQTEDEILLQSKNEEQVTDEEWLKRCEFEEVSLQIQKRCEFEEKRKQNFLSQIIEERHLCARLKAQIEMLQLERQEGFEATRL